MSASTGLASVKLAVFQANLSLVDRGLVLMTWGNASAIDRDSGRVVIKPSGVAYAEMNPDRMAVTDLEGNVVEGKLKPSVDLPTHLALYKAFPSVGGIVHTHSLYATCFAQACRPIPCLGTTHADFSYGEVPVTEALTETEVADNYERHIGEAIVRRFQGLDPMQYPAVLAAKHGPFVWGKMVSEAVENAYVLEKLAQMALHTLMLSPDQPPIEQYLLDKHFLRKHGRGAYYGQR